MRNATELLRILYDGDTAATIETALSGLDATKRAAAAKQLSGIESGPNGKELVKFFLAYGGLEWKKGFKDKGVLWGDGNDRSKWLYVSEATATSVTLEIDTVVFKKMLTGMKTAYTQPSSGFKVDVNLTKNSKVYMSVYALETLTCQDDVFLRWFPGDYQTMTLLRGGLLGCPTNLKRLDLRGCKALTSLPDSIGNLTNLQTLDLRGCGELRGALTSFPDLSHLVAKGLEVWGGDRYDHLTAWKNNGCKAGTCRMVAPHGSSYSKFSPKSAIN